MMDGWMDGWMRDLQQISHPGLVPGLVCAFAAHGKARVAYWFRGRGRPSPPPPSPPIPIPNPNPIPAHSRSALLGSISLN